MTTEGAPFESSSTPRWKECRYKKIVDYVRAAEEFPDDIPCIAHWAYNESDVGEKKMLAFYNALLDRGVVDVDARIYKHGGTLLLASVKAYNISIVRMLLARGADVTVRDDRGYGVLDVLLRSFYKGGHGVTTKDMKRVLHALMTLLPHVLERKDEEHLHDNTKIRLRDNWTDYRKDFDIMAILRLFL